MSKLPLSELGPLLREQAVIAKTELKQARARKRQGMSLGLLSQLPPRESLASVLRKMDKKKFCEYLLEVILGRKKKKVS